jgi:glycosyltransferase involved in cell wall biosynthesis
MSHRADASLQRLLVLSSTLEVGGGERVLASLLRGLRGGGLGVELCFLKRPGAVGETLLAEGFAGRALGLDDTRSPRILPALLRLLRERQPDLLYIQDHHDCLFWGRLAAALHGFLPALSPVHSSAAGRLRAFRLYNRLLLGLSPNLATLGAWQERALEQRERVPRGLWRRIPNPVPAMARLAPAAGLSGREGRVELVCVAALRPEKRLDRLLRLVDALRRLLPVRLTLIGEGAERPRLESLAEALDLGEALRLTGQRDDVPELLPGFDLFVLGSDEEALPVSVLEALAAGLPVAAPPHGALPELLGGGRGLLLRGEDPAAWAEQLARYLEAPPAAADRAALAGRIAEEHAPERFAARYLRLLSALGGQG